MPFFRRAFFMSLPSCVGSPLSQIARGANFRGQVNPTRRFYPEKIDPSLNRCDDDQPGPQDGY
jgi:hypothetical protein